MSETAESARIWSQHVHSDDLPWVSNGTGRYRLLQVKPADMLIVSEWHFEPGRQTCLHRHNHPVLAFTYDGAWGHTPGEFEYRRGTYVYEPVEVLHRFHNGPGKTHCMFVIHGDIEVIDPETNEVIERLTPASSLAAYLQGCESEGLPRPNLLT